MHELFNRRPSDDAVGFWVSELAPHYGPYLFEALHEGCRAKFMPSINEILEFVSDRKFKAHEQAYREQQERDAAEEARKQRIKREEWAALAHEQRSEYNAKSDAMWRAMDHKYGITLSDWARRQYENDRGLCMFQSSVDDPRDFEGDVG